jgi:hypothetical protein
LVADDSARGNEAVLSEANLREVGMLLNRASGLYDALRALPLDDREHRHSIWSEILHIHDRITRLIPLVIKLATNRL